MMAVVSTYQPKPPGAVRYGSVSLARLGVPAVSPLPMPLPHLVLAQLPMVLPLPLPHLNLVVLVLPLPPWELLLRRLLPPPLPNLVVLVLPLPPRELLLLRRLLPPCPLRPLPSEPAGN